MQCHHSSTNQRLRLSSPPLNQSEASSSMRHFAALYENPTYITHHHPTHSADHTHTHTASDRVSSAADALFFVFVCHISIFKMTLHKTVIFLNEQHVICVDYKKVWLSPDYSPLMVMDRLEDVSSD